MNMLNMKLTRDLIHLRGQLLALSLVVACGIAVYVTMRSTYDSLTTSQDLYYRNYRFADIFVSLKRAPENVKGRIQQISGVSFVEPRIVFEVTLDLQGLKEPAIGRLVSIPENRLPSVNTLCLRRGRYPDASARNEVLVSETFATANRLQVGNSIPTIMNGKYEKLQIVGLALSPEYVYEIRGAEILPDNRRFGVMWMPRNILGSTFNMEGAFNDLAITISHGASERTIISEVDRILEPYGGLGAYGREDQISHYFLSGEIDETKVTAVLIPAIFLGVAAFLVNIILTRLIGTQRSQIAVLKAFGYENAAIGLHFLKLGMTSVVAGTVIGIFGGIWLGKILSGVYARFFHFPTFYFDVALDVIVLTIFISAGSAGVGAVSAVIRAIRLPPAEGIRPEPPAAFRAGLFERLGFKKFLPITYRMIFRNIERRPAKAFLSVLGMAFAIAILVTGRYFFDAIERIVEVQFGYVQKEDVSIVFNNPVASRARYEISRLPGIIYSEPFRIVPVRLRLQHRVERVSITGIYPNSRLRLLLDRDLRNVQVPVDGIVLTTKLADLLKAKTGDILTVEMLEGDRSIRRIAVTGLVDELIGTASYMDAAALFRFLKEDRTISGAYLLTDSQRSDDLYAALKQVPSLNGLAIREALLTSFDKTIAESLRISTNMLIGFACVIAFGMIYNSSRIALSERGTELASLRILGFTKREIAFMLLGEQSVLTLLSIPLGYIIGFVLCLLAARWKESELFRLPLVVTYDTYAFAVVVISITAILSSLFVLRRLYKMDLIEVLKSRE
jgi:putative ABC transport system permease protein